MDSPTADAVNETFVILSWSPPSPANGRVFRYILEQDGIEVCCTDARTTHMVTGLDPATEYQFTIRGVTGDVAEYEVIVLFRCCVAYDRRAPQVHQQP